ncbi:MAG TPA: DCC1-like thiol-disulfide oxidoreductase family protein [Propylenella sp.]
MQPTADTLAAPEGRNAPVLVYDGECPFCSAYVRMVRLRETFGALRLVDARSGDPLVGEIRAAGLDLDKGMVLKLDGELYFGDRCLHVLALMSTPSGAFNRVTRALFASPRLARRLYPFLVAGRNAALILLGRRKINAPPSL